MSFVERAPALTEEELDALTRAATWYASYHARAIASEADEMHAYAIAERRSYLALVGGLRKLGIRFALPDELTEHARQAA